MRSEANGVPLVAPDYEDWLLHNPLYRRECYVAWRLQDGTLRRFLEGDEATRLFLVRNLDFLEALFDLPEYREGE